MMTATPPTNQNQSASSSLEFEVGFLRLRLDDTEVTNLREGRDFQFWGGPETGPLCIGAGLWW